MSAMSELMLEIQSMAHDMGDDFGYDAETVKTISRVLQIPVADVQAALDPEYIDDYDDSMDGDFDSAMASAGYGMDEDY
jgi:imidazole glycerol phosphate synthase subunit HisF